MIETATVGMVHSFAAMLAVSNVVAFVRVTLLVLFLGVSLAMLAAGVLRRSRFSSIRMFWGTGRLFGLPLGPTLFLLAALALIAFSIMTERRVMSIGWATGSVYVAGGICWYLGALLSSATIVTDSGVSLKSGGRSMLLAWHDVTDYLVTSYRRRIKYVFFRVDAQGYKRRVEVFVPSGMRDRFQSIVEFKLDGRFNRSFQRPMGQKALEQ